jgi:hypothetical protein
VLPESGKDRIIVGSSYGWWSLGLRGTAVVVMAGGGGSMVTSMLIGASQGCRKYNKLNFIL